MPIVRSLEISADSTGNRVLTGAVREAAENISAGQSLAVPLAESGHFPADVVEMIAVAEQSNTLEKVLPHVADTLERRHLAAAGPAGPAAGAADAADPGRRRAGGGHRPAGAGPENEHDGLKLRTISTRDLRTTFVGKSFEELRSNDHEQTSPPQHSHVGSSCAGPALR